MFVDLAVTNFPSPNKSKKFSRIYEGAQTGQDFENINKADKNGPCVVFVTKQFHKSECDDFYLFGRVISGSIKTGDKLTVLGEKFSVKNPEQKTLAEVLGLFVNNTRYKIPVSCIPAGNFVLIEGIDSGLSKTCTLVSNDILNSFEKSLAVTYNTFSIIKVALEPLNPAELPKMLDGLRKLNKSYPLLETKVQETGEHIIIGTGELYMDNVLHDLRNLYTDIEIKLSDPCVILTETVIDTSSFKSFSQTPNGMNKITVIAEPLEASISNDIQMKKINTDDPFISRFFEENYQ